MEIRPTRHAIALAIFAGDSYTVVAGKRANLPGKEYSGYWSIPTQRVSADEYQQTLNGHPSDEMIERLLDRKLARIPLRDIRILKVGERSREDYDLKMIVLGCNMDSQIPSKTDYYDPIQEMDALSILKLNGYRCGTCVSLLCQYLVDIQVVDPGLEYFELSPTLANSTLPLEEHTPEELWKLAAGDYELLLSGKLGGDGLEVRTVTLDKALQRHLNQLTLSTTRFLDVGCGDGSITEQMHRRTHQAYGIDLHISKRSHDYGKEANINNLNLVEGSIYSLDEQFPENSFDLVLLNLVVQWLPDLDHALIQLHHVIAPQGRVVVTLTSPHATHCGQWRLDDNNKYVWEYDRRIPEKKLVMLNRMVGPLWFFGRSIITLVNAFKARAFQLISGEEIFLDSYLSHIELESFLSKWPAFRRSLVLPPFTILEFAAEK
jgi:SAM-dependent methyltransferase